MNKEKNQGRKEDWKTEEWKEKKFEIKSRKEKIEMNGMKEKSFWSMYNIWSHYIIKHMNKNVFNPQREIFLISLAGFSIWAIFQVNFKIFKSAKAKKLNSDWRQIFIS